jgi:hypothetical protein
MCCKEKRNPFSGFINGDGSVNKVNEETLLLQKTENPMEKVSEKVERVSKKYGFPEKHDGSSSWGKKWLCLTILLNEYGCGTIGVVFLVAFILFRELYFKQIGSSNQILPSVEEILGKNNTAAFIRCFNDKGIPYCSEVVEAFNAAKKTIGAILAWFKLGITQSTKGTWPFIAFPLVSWLAPYLFGAVVDFVKDCWSSQEQKDFKKFKERRDLKDPRRWYFGETLLFGIVKAKSTKGKVLKGKPTKNIICNDTYKIVPRTFVNYGKGSMLFTAFLAAVVFNRLYVNYWYGDRVLGSEEWQTKKAFLFAKVIVNLLGTNIKNVTGFLNSTLAYPVELGQNPYMEHPDKLIDGLGIVDAGPGSLAIDDQKYVKEHVFDALLKNPWISKYINPELGIDILAALIFILIPGLASKYFNSKSKYLTREMNKNAVTYTNVQLQDNKKGKPDLVGDNKEKGEIEVIAIKPKDKKKKKKIVIKPDTEDEKKKDETVIKIDTPDEKKDEKQDGKKDETVIKIDTPDEKKDEKQDGKKDETVIKIDTTDEKKDEKQDGKKDETVIKIDTKDEKKKDDTVIKIDTTDEKKKDDTVIKIDTKDEKKKDETVIKIDTNNSKFFGKKKINKKEKNLFGRMSLPYYGNKNFKQIKNEIRKRDERKTNSNK